VEANGCKWVHFHVLRKRLENQCSFEIGVNTLFDACTAQSVHDEHKRDRCQARGYDSAIQLIIGALGASASGICESPRRSVRDRLVHKRQLLRNIHTAPIFPRKLRKARESSDLACSRQARQLPDHHQQIWTIARASFQHMPELRMGSAAGT
jgi:hypothetical protein